MDLFERRFERIDSRTDFITTWLMEMPMRNNGGDLFEKINEIIKERILSDPSYVIKLPNNLNKFEGPQLIYYWYELNNEILLGIELEKRSQALVINLIGKNPKIKGKAPFASDLYDAILNDQHQPIRLMSDSQLSDEGYNIWKKLFSLGHKIGVYDRSNPGQSYKKLNSEQEMDQFFGNDISYKSYQFVLLETSMRSSEVISFFGTRRYRELIQLNSGTNMVDP